MLLRVAGSDPAGLCVFCDVVLRDDGDALATSHIANTHYVVVTLLRFLAAARDSAVRVTCIDPRIEGNGWGALVRLPFGVRREIDDIAFFKFSVIEA